MFFNIIIIIVVVVVLVVVVVIIIIVIIITLYIFCKHLGVVRLQTAIERIRLQQHYGDTSPFVFTLDTGFAAKQHVRILRNYYLNEKVVTHHCTNDCLGIFKIDLIRLPLICEKLFYDFILASTTCSAYGYALLLGTNLIHDFTAVTFSVKLAFFREKRLFP